MSSFPSSITLCVLVFASIIVFGAAAPGVATKQTLNDGNNIPNLGLGTFLDLRNNKHPPKQVVDAVEAAIDAGYRHFDTAAIYRNEQYVGQAIANKIKNGTVTREELFISTKLWITKHAPDQVVPALRESLEKLGLDYVDLYLMHWPMAFTSDYKSLEIDYVDTWKGLEQAKKLGLAKSIGVANFNQQQLTRLLENSEVKPAVLQIEVNPNLTEQKLVGFAQNNSIVVVAYMPFGWFVGSKATGNPPNLTLAPRIDDPILTAMAHKYGKTTPQIVLRYLVDRSIIPIPKSSNKNRIEQNISIFDFHLTEDEVKKIDEFNRDYRINTGFFADHPFYPFKETAIPESSSKSASS